MGAPLSGATRDVWEPTSQSGDLIVSGSAGIVTTLSPAHVVKGPRRSRGCRLMLRVSETGGCKAMTNQASFRVEPLVTHARGEWLLKRSPRFI